MKLPQTNRTMIHVMLILALGAVELTLAQLCLWDLVKGYCFEVGFHQLLQFCHPSVVGAYVVCWVNEVHVVLARTVAFYWSIVHYQILLSTTAHLKEPSFIAHISYLYIYLLSFYLPMFL